MPEPVLEGVDASLLDIVDHVLTKGIVLTGDLVLGVADIDLVYLRLSAVLCAADRILGPSPNSGKRRTRHAASEAAPGRPGLMAKKIAGPRLSGARARRP
jgi:Gas vesicle protein